MDDVTRPPTLGGLFGQSTSLLFANAAPLAALCTLGVGFDALLTYVGGFITFGYGEPVFALVSTVLQEVLYFGPAVLLWDLVLRERIGDDRAEPRTGPLDGAVFGTLVSGFASKRAWSIALAVTVLYSVVFFVLGCLGLAAGGFLTLFVPGALTIAVKLLRTVIGPVVGLGYLATAIAVARPARSAIDAMLASAKLMLSRPLLIGLVLSVGGFLEEAAGLTVVLGILLDAFLLCYCTVLLRSLREAGQLPE